MAKKQRWVGPFKFAYDNRTCVKCEKLTAYKLNFCGFLVSCCREHALEGLVSKEGGRTLDEAKRELAEIDADRWQALNTHRMTWVPIAERLPTQKRQRVILSDGEWTTIGHLSGNGWYVDESAEACGPTALARFSHWMEMPPAPRPL